MKDIDDLQIGHSFNKGKDFYFKSKINGGEQTEVPFSHSHHFYAIYWIHEGNGVHVIDFEEYEIKPDRIFFIRPQQIHFLCNKDEIKYSALQYTDKFMIPLFWDIPREIPIYKDLNAHEKKRISILFEQIHTESSSSDLLSSAIIQSEIHTLLLELERLASPNRNKTMLPDLLNKYNKLIEESYHKEHQVQYYANTLGISPNYLNVLAKKYTGKTALRIINKRVLLEIKRLLLRTDYDISEIAYRLGFSELSYFSRFFKHHTGMTPQEFRNLMYKMYQR